MEFYNKINHNKNAYRESLKKEIRKEIRTEKSFDETCELCTDSEYRASNLFYVDPDGEYDSDYYREILCFLNLQEKKLIEESQQYKYQLITKKNLSDSAKEQSKLERLKEELNFDEKVQADIVEKGYKVPPGIAVYKKGDENEKPILYLRTDLFGFSAPRKQSDGKKIAWNEKYPYGSFLLQNGQVNIT